NDHGALAAPALDLDPARNEASDETAAEAAQLTVADFGACATVHDRSGARRFGRWALGRGPRRSSRSAVLQLICKLNCKAGVWAPSTSCFVNGGAVGLASLSCCLGGRRRRRAVVPGDAATAGATPSPGPPFPLPDHDPGDAERGHDQAEQGDDGLAGGADD